MPPEAPTPEVLCALDPAVLAWIQWLTARLDAALADNERLREQNAKLLARVQLLEDEVARLKNVPPKPPAARPTPPKPSDHSSEKERNDPKARIPRKKDPPIDRTVAVPLPLESKPPGARFHGYERTTIQEIVLGRDNVCFERERWIDPETGETFTAPLPQGWQVPSFGPELRALVLRMGWKHNDSHGVIHQFLQDLEIDISEGEINDILVHQLAVFEAERAAVHRAGVETSACVQSDVTPTRVDGQDRSCFVTGDDRFVTYDTRESHDRLQTLCALCGWDTPRYLVNDEVVARAGEARVGATHMAMLLRMPHNRVLSEKQFAQAFSEAFEETTQCWVGDKTRTLLHEVCALGAAWQQTPALRTMKLHADDARHFDGLCPIRGLCWIHEGRHITKLSPGSNERACVEVAWFRQNYWALYRAMQAYRDKPTATEAKHLEVAFDALFACEPSWGPLRDRIGLTREKRAELLCVLDHPQMPLHNNERELDARARVRKRDTSFGPRSEAGRAAWDTMQSVLGTARRLGINAWKYLKDRVLGAFEVPSLASQVRARGQLPAPSS